MQWSFGFIFNSMLLGIGLAMDAFSVSLANGLSEPCMKRKKQAGIALVFAFFQALMPLLGWYCVTFAKEKFTMFERFIPWIALILLGYIGFGMIREGVKHPGCEEANGALNFTALIIQGIATSIDALSVGFTISNYNFISALMCALIIAAVTFIICAAGVSLGKRFGTVFAGKSSIFGGIILIGIGIEIFVTGLL